MLWKIVTEFFFLSFYFHNKFEVTEWFFTSRFKDVHLYDPDFYLDSVSPQQLLCPKGNYKQIYSVWMFQMLSVSANMNGTYSM